jgi:hypothetical protein
VYGFDLECERDEQWQAQMNVSNPNQPFYYVLPDAADSVGIDLDRLTTRDSRRASEIHDASSHSLPCSFAR